MVEIKYIILGGKPKTAVITSFVSPASLAYTKGVLL